MSLPKILLYALSFVGVVLLGLSVFGDSHDPLLYYIYLILFLGVAAALFSAFSGLATNPGSIKKSFTSIGAVVVSLVIGFVFSSSKVLPFYGEITESVSKWSGVGLITFYCLFVIAVGTILYSAFRQIAK